MKQSDNLIPILAGTSTLLIGPKTFGYEQTIMAAIKKLGGCCTYIDERPSNDFLTKGIIRLKSSVLKSRTHRYFNNALLALGDNLSFDYVLVISPEAIDESIIATIRNRYPLSRMILYMWDSIQNKSGRDNSKLLPLFDRIFSFDKNDCEIYPVMNFRPLFFRTSKSDDEDEVHPSIDLSFIGTVHSDRYKICSEVQHLAESMGLTTFFYLYLSDRRLFWIYRLINPAMRRSKLSDFSYRPLSEEKVNQILADSKCVLDIQHPKQIGLTMRTIEVIGGGRKLLTTNAHIKEYDFYNHDNIQHIDRIKPKFEKEFIQTPYKSLDPIIYNKYSVYGWIKEIFEIS